MRRLLTGCLALWAFGCSSGDEGAAEDVAPEPAPMTAGVLGVWAEFMTPAQATEKLPLLRSHGLALNMAWPKDSAQSAELYALALAGEKLGVEVRPWLLLPESEGYWPGSTNAEAFAALAGSVMDRWEQEGLRPTWLIVDMELRYDRAMELQEKLGGEGPIDIAGFIAFFKEGVDEAQFAAATETYQKLVFDAHTRGWRVLLTTLPNVLDDYADGDDSLRQALGVPIDDIAWDLMTFQAYTTLMAGLFEPLLDGKAVTSFMVYDYALTAKQLFGHRAGLDLGLVGSGVGGSPIYSSPEDLRADIEAAHAAGVPPERINVYNLDGMIDRGTPESWLTSPTASPSAPPPDEGTAVIRGTIKTLDATN